MTTNDKVHEIEQVLLGSVHGGAPREATMGDACVRGFGDGAYDGFRAIAPTLLTVATLVPFLGGQKVTVGAKMIAKGAALVGLADGAYMGATCLNNMNQLKKSRDPITITPNK